MKLFRLNCLEEEFAKMQENSDQERNETNESNKKFDEEDWKTHVSLVVYQYDDDKKGNKICTIERDIDVPRTENLVIVSEGYGNDNKGEFWNKGKYIWEALIEGKSIATKGASST